MARKLRQYFYALAMLLMWAPPKAYLPSKAVLLDGPHYMHSRSQFVNKFIKYLIYSLKVLINIYIYIHNHNKTPQKHKRKMQDKTLVCLSKTWIDWIMIFNWQSWRPPHRRSAIARTDCLPGYIYMYVDDMHTCV